MPATAQINVRIDSASKTSGDAGILAAGLSTSEVVRAVWDVCAQYKDSPSKLKDWLFPNEASKKSKQAQQERQRRHQLIEEGSSMYAQFCAERGLTPIKQLDAYTDEALEAAALFDEFGEGMGMSEADFKKALHD